MFGSVHRNDDPDNPNTLNGPRVSQQPETQPTITTGMSWELRVQSFIGLLILSIIASFSGSYLLLLTKITGFCIMTSISAVLSLSSTCCLMGPVGQLKKMFDKSRWIASSMYILMILLTLISGLVLKNALLAIICTVGQYVSMAWRFVNPNFPHQGSSAARENRKRSGSASGMSFSDHIEAIKKEMTTMNSQLGTNKSEIERARQENSSIQQQIQMISDQGTLQMDLQKAAELTKKLENIARTFCQTISDQSQQAQLLAELESIAKNGAGQMSVMTPPMMNAVAAAAMHPHMMMRNPMMNAMNASPRVGKGGAPNGGLNGMAMMHQMQAQAMMQAQAAMMQAHMFQQMPMMGVPGMIPGMPPGMAGLPGMMPPNSAAAAAAAMQQFNAAQVAAAIATSTPSRNPSTSGAASRTRTPLTASATNSPRPITEPVIKEEDPPSMEADVTVTATSAATIKQEENSTVAVA
ncbi:unnamed protein product [Caenorhabditis sp. 36 PRJEB53466]|nr:unnamed protein product [Caenorhabditis sp. 36 PRJEB53466]